MLRIIVQLNFRDNMDSVNSYTIYFKFFNYLHVLFLDFIHTDCICINLKALIQYLLALAVLQDC